MPNWKKVIVSGSNAHFNQVTASGDVEFFGDVSGGSTSTGSFGIVQSEGLTANESVIVGADGKSLISTDLFTFDTTNNRLGIGTTSPEVKLHIDGDAAQEAQIRLEQHNNTADAPDIRIRRSRGTHASPSTLAANDYQFRLNIDIYDGSDYTNAGQLRWDNDGTTDNNGTNNVFGLQTRAGGSTADRLTIDKSGNATFSGNLNVNGDISGSTIRASGDVIAFNSSDKRYKDNIQPISEPLYKISKVGGYTFDWNDEQDTYEGHDIGVIAQEIEEVLPEVVTTRGNGFKAVKYEKIVPLLIESIKELKQEVDEIKQKCDCLNK